MRVGMWAVCGLAMGCVTTESSSEQRVDALGATGLTANVHRGDFAYSVADEASVVVDGTSWGSGVNVTQAVRNIDGTSWTAERIDSEVVINGNAAFRRSGVDFDVEGPAALNLDVELSAGDAVLRDVLGSHRVVASRIEAIRLAGDADLRSTQSGGDFELYPYEDGVISIESYGTTVLRLPAYQGYDLEVFGDEGQYLALEDIGFDELIVEDGYASAWRFPGTIRVTVYVTGGAFELYEAR